MRVSTVETVAAVLGLTGPVLLYEVVPEEIVFRGYFFTALAERYSTRMAIPVQALLFMLWGVLIGAAETLDRAVLFVVFAFVLGIVRTATGSMWSCMGFHAAFQVTTQFLIGGHWHRIHLDDPDLAAAGLAFVATPFLGTTVLPGWRSRRGRA